jgi:hypothetical protein
MHFAHLHISFSLLPRLGEPLAHPLELWFLLMCVRYLPIITPTKSSKCLLRLSFFYSIDMCNTLIFIRI